MRRDQIESAALLEYLEAEITRPRYVLVVAEFLVHERVGARDPAQVARDEAAATRLQDVAGMLGERAPRGAAAEPCWCCQSLTCVVVERIPDQRVMFDRVTGQRWHEDHADPEAFEEFARIAQRVPLYWRCTAAQMQLLREGDDPRRKRKVIAALGGSRSGKTQAGVMWLLRRWLRRGGARRAFWFVAPSLAQSWIAVEKLLHGDAGNPAEGIPAAPAILPQDEDGRPLLVRRAPVSVDASDLALVLIDGTRIEMKHARDRTGKTQKGYNVIDILVDEACEIDHADTWGVIVSRTTGSDGCVYAATTPKPGHYLKAQIVDQAERVEDGGRVVGNSLFVSYSLSKRGNVWYTVASIEADIAAMPNDSVRAREGEGIWVEDGQGQLYLEYAPEQHRVYATGFSLADLGLGDADITAAVIRRAFPGDNPLMPGRTPPMVRRGVPSYIGGSDVNVTPFVTVVAQVEALDIEDRYNPSKWRLWIFDNVVSRRQTAHGQAELIQSDKRARDHLGWVQGDSPYKGLPVFIDPSACYSNPTAPRLAKAKGAQAPTAAGIMTQAGLDVRPCHYNENNKPQQPRILARVNLVQELLRTDRLRISNKCDELLRSLTLQQNDGRGMPLKEPNEASDRLSAAADALGYLCWGVFLLKPKARGTVTGLQYQ